MLTGAGAILTFCVWREQVQQGQPASSTAAVSTMLAEMVAEQQALKQVQHLCDTLAKS